MGAPDIRARLLGVIEAHRSGRLAEAIIGYRQVLETEPKQFDALRLLGAALLAAGEAGEALAALERALALRTDLAEAWSLRGDALARLSRPREAVESYQRALSFGRESANLLAALAMQLQALGENAVALAAIDRALAREPRQALLWQYRASMLVPLERCEEALDGLERCVELGGATVETLNLRALAYRLLGRPQQALSCCDAALRLAPGIAASVSLRGAVLAELGRREDAAAMLEQAIALDPSDAQARFNLGMLHLTEGRFEQGWAGYAWRSRVRQFGMQVPEGVRNWDGAVPLGGRTMFVRSEQGLGDCIQFSRYLPLLARAGARVVLAAPAAFAPLAESIEGVARVLTDGDPMPAFDLQCELGALPRLFGTRLQTIPAELPYLAPPVPRLENWRRRLGPRLKQRIGLVCSGNSRHVVERDPARRRSIALQAFARLAVPGRELHLLQVELAAGDEKAISDLGVFDHRRELRDFADTAALASCMDAVVSIDTSGAHLAGALGLCTLILVPAIADWRWLLDRDDSPWYPNARVYRGTLDGNWHDAIARVAAELDTRRGASPD